MGNDQRRATGGFAMDDPVQHDPLIAGHAPIEQGRGARYRGGMSEHLAFEEMTDEIIAGLRAKLGVRAKDLESALNKARRHLPRRVFQQAMTLVDAQPMAGHPRLRQMLDGATLKAAADEVNAHLEAIDLGERRKSLWLGALGGLVFNLILMAVVIGGFLYWRAGS